MKYSVQSLLLTILSVAVLSNTATTAFAAKVATLTTSINGGIRNTEQSFIPFIAFKGDTPLFSTKKVTIADEGVTFILASDFDDINYAKFIEKLTDNTDDFLTIGHKIGEIKSEVSSIESTWFDGLTFSGKKIGFITLTYSNLKFEVSKDNPNEWTTFSYELTLNIFDDNDTDGVAHNRDNDTDGVAVNEDDAIDFAFIDYGTLEQMEGTTMTKGGTTTNGLKIQKTTDGMFIVSPATKETKADSEEIKKMAIKIMYLSTSGAAKNTKDGH